jgi:hypothetical protein
MLLRKLEIRILINENKINKLKFKVEKNYIK